MRRLAASVAVLVALLAAPALAAPVELSGALTISTSTAGSVLVHVPQVTKTFPDENGKGALTTAFSGKGALRVLVLLGETAGADGKRYAGYIDGSLTESGESTWSGQDLPAGDYRLYALSDGQPMTVKLTMPYGAGDGSLALTDPAGYDVHAMRTGSGGVFRASAVTTGQGVVFGSSDVTFASGQAGTVEFCEAVGDSAETDGPYALGCSQGANLFPSLGGGGGPAVLGSSTRIEVPGAGRHGFGGNAQSLTPPAVRGGVGALTFTPPGVPGQAGAPVGTVRGVEARVVSTKVRVTKTGRAPVKVRCAGPGTCRVRLVVSGEAAKGKASIPSGATKKVNVRLSKALRKRLKRARSVRVTVVLQVTSAEGATTTTRRRITLTAPRR